MTSLAARILADQPVSKAEALERAEEITRTLDLMDRAEAAMRNRLPCTCDWDSEDHGRYTRTPVAGCKAHAAEDAEDGDWRGDIERDLGKER